MTAFETFVAIELPRRSALLTKAITSYDGDPNDVGAPDDVKNAPLGTWFREETAAKWWRQTETVYEEPGGNPFDQDLNTTDSPTFAGLTLGGLLTDDGSGPLQLGTVGVPTVAGVGDVYTAGALEVVGLADVGSLIIGAPSVDAMFQANRTSNPSVNTYGGYLIQNYSVASANIVTGTKYIVQGTAGSGNQTGRVIAWDAVCQTTGNHNVTNLLGVRVQVGNKGGGTITNLIGAEIYSESTAGNITNLKMVNIRTPFSTGATITNHYGLNIDDVGKGTTVNYAIRTGLGAVKFGDSLIMSGLITDDGSSALQLGTAGVPVSAGPGDLYTAGIFEINGMPIRSNDGVNVLIGQNAGSSLTSGSGNAFVGLNAGRLVTTGFANFAHGESSLEHVVTGNQNVAIGFQAGRGTFPATFGLCMYIGSQSGAFNQSGSFNVGVGAQTLGEAVSAESCVAIGHSALFSTLNSFNVGIGQAAFFSNTSGIFNVGVGYVAGQYATVGSGNTVVGAIAGRGVSGVSNYENSVMIGTSAGRDITTGDNNLLVGYATGNNLTTGSNNILIGYFLTASAGGVDNELNIGGLLKGDLAAPQFRFAANTAAPADASLDNGDVAFWVDEATNDLKVKVKYSGGTVKSGTVAALT